MKNSTRYFTQLFIVFALMLSSTAFSSAPGLINYQGRLVQGTNLFTGAVNLELRLYNASAGGTLLYNDATLEAVTDGLYSTYIGDHTASGNLQLALTNEQVWLEVVVNGTPLSPRERLVSVPYARMVEGLLVGTNRNVTINPGLSPLNPVSLLNIATGYGAVVGGGNENQALAFAATISGGQNNQAAKTAATVGGGFINTAGDDFATVGGGESNYAANQHATIAGGGNNVAGGEYATVGGGHKNQVLGLGSVIAGGVSNVAVRAYATVAGGTRNIASNEWSTVGGGSGNQAIGDVATVGGGTANRASATWAAVGGGAVNMASGLGSFVGGGYANIATTLYATVAGGFQNTAGGAYAAVPGGFRNTASGSSSMAAGNRAKAVHDGTFVWADSTAADFTSTGADQFLIRADGGVGINTDTPLAPLHVFGSDPVGQFSGQLIISGTTDSGVSNSGAGLRLAGNDGNGPREWGFIRALKSNSTVGNTQSHMSFGTRLQGGSLTERMRLDTTGLRVNGTFVSSSDREKKQDIVPVNPQEILDHLVDMPVHFWRYREDPATLHVGPMAQDFHAAFGVGPDERHIASVDADGVALAAIQALAEDRKIFADRVSALEEENTRLRERLESLEQKMGM